MRILTLLISILLPAFICAQYTYPLPGSVPAGSHLLKLGSETILIHPIDINNQSHKWIAFDSTLAAISTKKLITPGAENIISQIYLESVSSVFRIDQFLLNGELIVSAFVFDVKGNLIRKKQIETIFDTGKKSVPLPFYVAQSPDKRVVSLIQALVVGADNLSVLSIVLDELLNVSNPRYFTVPFKPALFDLYMPLVNNDKTVFIPMADKFNSYKLSSVVNGYVLTLTENNSKAIQFNFERKKIKELNFQFSDDKIIFTGLYSNEKDKDEVAGVFYSGYDLKKHQHVKTEEYVFSDNVKAGLKKTYGTERRKGNLLNYLSILPTSLAADGKYSYAILLPEPNTPVIGNLQSQPHALFASDHLPKRSSPSSSRQRLYDKNLLFFDFKNPDSAASHRFLKIKNAPDSAYTFSTYITVADGLGALHYVVPDFETPYLKSITINANGKLAEKKVFEDKCKIILSNYPALIDADTLITFYGDKLTGQMGLIRLKL